MFTFLHAADLHLDSPLRGLDRYEGAPVDDIRGATRRALENLVSLAIHERVGFVVIAGDLYDGDWPDYNTGLFFVSQMARLKDAGVPVFAVSGNHDAANRMTKRLPLPDNVTLFSTVRPETVRLEALDVAVHGQSFANQCTTDDLAAEYPPPVAGSFNIGVLHTSLAGSPEHDSYAPCSVACLQAKGYDYWALGHVHTRAIIGRDPIIAFPGNPQGRHAREPGAKGCFLVTVEGHEAEVAFRPLDVFRWWTSEVDVSQAQELAELVERVSEEVRLALTNADGLPLALRVRLVGETPLFHLLNADRRQFTNEIRALAVALGSGAVWVEKIQFDLTPPRRASEHDASLDGPLQELAAYLEEARLSEAAQVELLGELKELAQKLPPELSAALPSADASSWGGVLDEVEAQLMARLRN